MCVCPRSSGVYEKVLGTENVKYSTYWKLGRGEAGMNWKRARERRIKSHLGLLKRQDTQNF